MGGKTDVVKGRIKEAAGVLTGNDNLRAEGKADQTVGGGQAGRRQSRRQGQGSREEIERLKLGAVRERNWVADAEALPKPAQFNQRKGKIMDSTTLIILIVVLFLVFGGGGGYYWNRRGR